MRAWAMPAKKLVYQFKITRKETHPPDWRRIQVPSTYKFWDFHVAIKDAMGWLDCHLHEFRIQAKTGETLVFDIPSDDELFLQCEKRSLPNWKRNISTYESVMPFSYRHMTSGTLET
jgi:hypothetical protein